MAHISNVPRGKSFMSLTKQYDQEKSIHVNSNETIVWE